MSLSSAVYESPQLPVTVRCVAPAVNHQSRDQHWPLHGQQLTIRQLYDSAFLLANPIHNGMHYLLIAFSVYVYCVQAYCNRRSIAIRLKRIDGIPLVHPEVAHKYDGQTQPSIPLGSVNEYQLQLGRQRQVWFTLADERGVCR